MRRKRIRISDLTIGQVLQRRRTKSRPECAIYSVVVRMSDDKTAADKVSLDGKQPGRNGTLHSMHGVELVKDPLTLPEEVKERLRKMGFMCVAQAEPPRAPILTGLDEAPTERGVKPYLDGVAKDNTLSYAILALRTAVVEFAEAVDRFVQRIPQCKC